MNLRNINWKDGAMIIGFLLFISIISNALNYYQHRQNNLSALIPDWVMIQAAKPYLVATIASTIGTLIAWTFYYFSKYKATIVVGLLTYVFEFVNINFIGESWNF